MALRWTADQQKVIDARNCSMLVSAAAGSGKTAVLVERIIRRILDREHPADIERMLVMTFTRAAASEIRERIRAAIERELIADPGNAHLERQAVMAQYAQITTIDSFCLYILREYFDRIDLDPAFRVADEGEVLLLRRDVMKELLEDRYAAGEEDFLAFAETFAPGKTDDGIADLIFRVYEFSQSNPWPAEWLLESRREMTEIGNGEEETAWLSFLREDTARQAKELAGLLKNVLPICQDADGPWPYTPVIEKEAADLERLALADGYREMASAAADMDWEKMPTIGKKMAESIDGAKKKLVYETRTQVKKSAQKLVETYFALTPEAAEEDMRFMAGHVLELLSLTEEFTERFDRKKREKNIVDFGDLEHMALTILSREGEEEGNLHPAGPVADELSEMFDEILVDEYQDSNLVQEQLIRYLSGERFGRPDVVMVGDVKQSIYKFRLARPDLFLEKYKSYGKEESHRLIGLEQNFRSRNEVLSCTNDVFFQIMTEGLGGVQYTEKTALHPGASYPEDTEGRMAAELLLLDLSKDASVNADDERAELTKRELEAGMIAREILRITDPKTGLMLWDAGEKRFRLCEYRDIVILLRTADGWAEEFAEVLMRQGIAAFAETGGGYFSTLEVETILNLLAVIDNPMQDIPLAAVLRAPFCGLEDYELAQIKAFEKQTAEEDARGGRGLYGAVSAYLAHHREDSADKSAEKLGASMALIDELRRAAAVLPMHALLYRIYDRTGYYLYASALPGGEVRRANLDMLVEKASAYEETSYRGVFHFIRYIGELKKYNKDFGEAQADESHAGAVRLMTIHKSKGLEFPVVFAAGLAKQFNKQDLRGSVLVDADLGIGTDFIDSTQRLRGSTLKKNVMKSRMEAEQLGEELRVLYVAMTRAKEKLYLTAALSDPMAQMEKRTALIPPSGQVPGTLLKGAACMLDWIFMSMARGAEHLKVHVTSPAGLVQDTARGLRDLAEAEEALEKAKASGAGDPGYRALLEKAGKFSYAHSADTLLNIKMSVSGLKEKHLEEDEEALLLAAARMEEAAEHETEQETEDAAKGTARGKRKHAWDSKGGAERGTAYHRLLSLLPFAEMGPEADISGILPGVLEELVRTGAFSDREKELVRLQDICAFLESPLGVRARAAAAGGKLKREQQFVIGLPAREVGDWDSDELVVIQGIIDAFFEEEDGLVLYDYKTDRVDTPEELRERYSVQLDFYERALAQITGKPVKERYLYSFRFGMIPA